MQNKIDIRIAVITFSDALGNKMRRNRLARRHSHGAGKLLSEPADIPERTVQFIQQPLQTHCQLLSRFGEYHFSRRAVEQLHSRLRFKLLNAMAHRRLAEANHLPCPAKAAGLRDGDENAKLT